MTAKEYLQQVKVKNARIQNLQRDKLALRDMLYSLGNSGGDGERVQTTPDKDKLGTMYAKIDEKEREITASIDDLIDFRFKVSEEINQLDDGRYIDVLYRCYVLDQGWKQIAGEMGYNIRYVQQLNGQALLEFQKVHGDMLKRYDKIT